jgi:hypothetical protein
MTARKNARTGGRKSSKIRLHKKTLKDLGSRGAGPRGGLARMSDPDPDAGCEVRRR